MNETTKGGARCRFCFGNAGSIVEDAHHLCRERNRLGLATPCLGMRCRRCSGAGRHGRVASGPMLSLDLGPAAIARSIEATFPPCEACGGRGYLERAAWIATEVARVKAAGCDFAVGDLPCGAAVEVETMTERFGTWILVACEAEETHHREVRV